MDDARLPIGGFGYEEIDLSGSLRRVSSMTDGEFCHPATSRQSVLSSFKGTMTELSPVYEALRVVFVCATVKLSPGCRKD